MATNRIDVAGPGAGDNTEARSRSRSRRRNSHHPAKPKPSRSVRGWFRIALAVGFLGAAYFGMLHNHKIANAIDSVTNTEQQNFRLREAFVSSSSSSSSKAADPKRKAMNQEGKNPTPIPPKEVPTENKPKSERATKSETPKKKEEKNPSAENKPKSNKGTKSETPKKMEETLPSAEENPQEKKIPTENKPKSGKGTKAETPTKKEEKLPSAGETPQKKRVPKWKLAKQRLEQTIKERIERVLDAEEQEKLERERRERTTRETLVRDDDRLNIVLLYADDWTMNVLGKLNPDVKTPNIDQMADEGMLFVNNCVTTSVCWISRATLVTGTYYSRHLQASPGQQHMFQTHNWNETLFPRLRQAGYHTGMIGKWHAPSPRAEMKAAFDESERYFGKHWVGACRGFLGPGTNRTRLHVTECNQLQSVDFLKKRPRGKKFALKVSFFATHHLDNTTPSYNPMNWTRFGYYPDEKSHPNYTTIVPPKTATDQHYQALPHFMFGRNAARSRWKKRWEPEVWQKNIRDIYAMATEVDWAVGEIVSELKRQGIYNETLLVFTTDNGDLHGEHGLAEKWYPYEESIRVPLVVRDPRMPKKDAGSIRSEWTLNVDLAPTLLGAAGLEASSFMQGRDIAELYLASGNETTGEGNGSEPRRWESNILQYRSENATKPWRKDWFYEWNTGDPETAIHHRDKFIPASMALVTNEWKYIYWPRQNYEQLFHRSVDPYDEYDVIHNYYYHQEQKLHSRHGSSTEQSEWDWMATFLPSNKTPYGDSVQSTKEIYEELKARFLELKHDVLSGKKI